jgi:hypothetical protein
MANLYVTITEEITLPNTTSEKTNVFKTISLSSTSLQALGAVKLKEIGF